MLAQRAPQKPFKRIPPRRLHSLTQLREMAAHQSGNTPRSDVERRLADLEAQMTAHSNSPRIYEHEDDG